MFARESSRKKYHMPPRATTPCGRQATTLIDAALREQVTPVSRLIDLAAACRVHFLHTKMQPSGAPLMDADMAP
jgi:hypothetical protein